MHLFLFFCILKTIIIAKIRIELIPSDYETDELPLLNFTKLFFCVSHKYSIYKYKNKRNLIGFHIIS